MIGSPKECQDIHRAILASKKRGQEASRKGVLKVTAELRREMEDFFGDIRPDKLLSAAARKARRERWAATYPEIPYPF